MKLRLKQIERDSKLSPRTKTDVEIAKGYADCFDQLPPIVVFKIPDKSNYLLVDGWHRYRAAEILKLEEIEVEARFGTLEQAEEYALLANLKHGLPLTRKERQGVIEKFLKLHFERTNNWISVDLGVHQDTVKRIRRKLEERLQIRIVKIFIGKDGREYPRTIERPKKEIQETEKAEEAEADSDEEEKQKIDEEENQEISSDESKTPPIPTLGVYELNKVHQVDCLEGFMGLPEASIDLVFADPPYNLSKKRRGIQGQKRRKRISFLVRALVLGSIPRSKTWWCVLPDALPRGSSTVETATRRTFHFPALAFMGLPVKHRANQ